MTWMIVSTVLGLLSAGACAACACLWTERRRLVRDLGAAERDRVRLTDEGRDLVGRIERADAHREASERQFAQAKETFQSLAGEALKSANEQFLQLAKQAFAGEQKDIEQRKAAVESMLKPIRETLDKHAAAVGEIEKHREGAYQGLRQQLTSMIESQRQLHSETQNLAGALRRSDVRGKWGEMTLRRLVELAGMVAHCDFDEQVTVRTMDGVQKPDMLVRLPAGRNLVIDAKTPMIAFLDAIRCEDDASRAECFRRHLEHIQQKVKDLSGKRYQDQFERAPDFVILFIPGESFLQPAVQLAPDLIERAMNLGVVIATPTTLISLLKAVEMGWREERVAENATRIRDLGVELHERVATATGYVDTLGKHLDNAVKSYNQFVGCYESRVLVSARKFRDLGADSPKELPADGQVRQVDASPRELRATDQVQA